MGSLSQDEFFNQLQTLFSSRKGSDHGAIFLSQKRYTHEQPTTASSTAPFPDLHPASPLPILIRATNGKSGEKRSERVKITTLVRPDELDAFYARYADVCKTGMAALKPRDRTKRKGKGKKKKVGGATGPVAA